VLRVSAMELRLFRESSYSRLHAMHNSNVPLDLTPSHICTDTQTTVSHPRLQLARAPPFHR
jgi:hypothetical protein